MLCTVMTHISTCRVQSLRTAPDKGAIDLSIYYRAHPTEKTQHDLMRM